jgi:hypothetical protein
VPLLLLLLFDRLALACRRSRQRREPFALLPLPLALLPLPFNVREELVVAHAGPLYYFHSEQSCRQHNSLPQLTLEPVEHLLDDHPIAMRSDRLFSDRAADVSEELFLLDGNFKASDQAHFKACGEQHLKARRALDTLVSERRGPQTWAERHGGSMVVCVAILLFVLAQLGLIFGRPVHRELLTLSPRTFATAAAMGVPQEVITKAKPLESVSFRNGEVAAARLKELAGADAFGKYGGQIMAAAERSEAEVVLESVDLGSYLTLTFGSVLLVIAGAYLPQLTSLKLAGVQLEKGSAERVETHTAITISR